MRYINKLEESSKYELYKVYRTHPKSHVRQRAQCLLLSDKGYSVPTLADIFSTRTHTVRDWFNRWEADGVRGLEIRPGRGLKPSINEDDAVFVASIREEVSLDPRNLSQVVEKLNQKWSTTLSVKQLKTFLKKS
jgi:transposase